MFNRLSNLKNFVLSNGSENVQNVIQIALKLSFFCKNLQKIFRPQTPIASGGWGLRSHAPSVTCFSCTNLLTTSPNLDRIEKFLTCRSSPSLLANSGYEPNQTPSFLSFILCSIISTFFRKILMTSLHVICGLAFPPIQNPGYAYALNHLQYAYQMPVVAS